jgi:hypothetical protein
MSKMQKPLVRRYGNLFDFLSFLWSLSTIFYSNIVTKIISVFVLILIIYKANLVKRILGIESKAGRIIVTLAGMMLGAFLGFLDQLTIFLVYKVTSFLVSFNYHPIVFWATLILIITLLFSPVIAIFFVFEVAKEIVKRSDFENLKGPAFEFLFKFQDRESIISEYKFYNKPLKEISKESEFVIGGSLFVMAFLVGIASLLSIKSSIILTLLTGLSASWKLINKSFDRIFSNIMRSWVFDLSSYFTSGIFGLISSCFLIFALVPLIILCSILSFSPETSLILTPIFTYILTYLGRLNARLKVNPAKVNHGIGETDILTLGPWPIDTVLFSFLIITFNLVISNTYSFSKYLLFSNSYSTELVELYFLRMKPLLILLSMLATLLLFAMARRKTAELKDIKKDKFRIPIAAASSSTVLIFINPLMVVVPASFLIVYYIVYWKFPQEIKEITKVASKIIYRDEAFYSILNKKCGMDTAGTYHAFLLGNIILLSIFLLLFGPSLMQDIIGYRYAIALFVAVLVFIFMSLYVHPIVHYIITEEKLIINTGFWIWKIRMIDIIAVRYAEKDSGLNIFKCLPIPIKRGCGLFLFKKGIIRRVIIFPQDIERFRKELEVVIVERRKMNL